MSSDGRRWVFQDVHDGGPSHAAGIRPSDVLLEANGEAISPPNLPTFARGTDQLLRIRSAAGDIRDVRIALPTAEPGKGSTPPMAEPTSVVSRSFDGGIGYVRILFFPGANGMRFARGLDRALAELIECDRQIIDLRGNLGGFVGSLRLMHPRGARETRIENNTLRAHGRKSARPPTVRGPPHGPCGLTRERTKYA